MRASDRLRPFLGQRWIQSDNRWIQSDNRWIQSDSHMDQRWIQSDKNGKKVDTERQTIWIQSDSHMDQRWGGATKINLIWTKRGKRRVIATCSNEFTYSNHPVTPAIIELPLSSQLVLARGGPN